MKERSDRLRLRPKKIRYFFLGVSRTGLHVGMSYGGLYAADRKSTVTTLYVADLATLKVLEVKEPVEAFMRRWRAHYNEPAWDYGYEMEQDIPAPLE